MERNLTVQERFKLYEEVFKRLNNDIATELYRLTFPNKDGITYVATSDAAYGRVIKGVDFGITRHNLFIPIKIIDVIGGTNKEDRESLNNFYLERKWK